MKLVVGLGNPGTEYSNTRHNAGFMAIDRISEHYNCSFSKKFNGLYAELRVDGEKIILLKPQKYMNLSGEVIKEYVDYFKIDVSDVLVIYDDMDINVGEIKLKYKGSSAGHNGLKDIERHLGTNEYKRIKIGISKNSLISTPDYVLGKFRPEELKKINCILDDMVNIFEDYLALSFERLMSKYNVRELTTV